MSVFDQFGNIDDVLEVPPLEDEANIPNIIQHISVLSDAIDKCEKILQHLAVGNYSADFEKYMFQHCHLMARKNELLKKLKNR